MIMTSAGYLDKKAKKHFSKLQYRNRIVYLLLLLIIGLFNSPVNAQNQTKYYEQFVKIWGVMKYKTNLKKKDDPCYWNKVFITSVSKISKIKGDNEFNHFIRDLLSKNCDIPRKLNRINSDLVTKLSLGFQVSNYLESYFDYTNVDLGPNQWQNFTTDNKCYKDVSTFEKKLLAIARLWNVLFYFHPNRDVDYLGALSKTLNLFYEKREIDKPLVELMRSCQDNLAVISTPFINRHLLKDFYYPSIKVRYLNNNFFILNSAVYGLENDTIQSINGIPINQLVDSILPWLPTTEEISKKNISFYLTAGLKNGSGKVVLKGNPNPIQFIYDQNGLFGLYDTNLLLEKFSNNVLYCDLIALQSKEDEKNMLKVAEQYDTIIFNLRGYVNFYPQDLFKGLKLAEIKIGTEIFDNRLSTAVIKRKSEMPSQQKNDKTLYVIVDKYTQSSSELLAIRLKQNGAKVIGDNSAGAIGVTSSYEISKNCFAIFMIKKFIDNHDYWAGGIPPSLRVPQISILTPSQIYRYLKKHSM